MHHALACGSAPVPLPPQINWALAEELATTRPVARANTAHEKEASLQEFLSMVFPHAPKTKLNLDIMTEG